MSTPTRDEIRKALMGLNYDDTDRVDDVIQHEHLNLITNVVFDLIASKQAKAAILDCACGHNKCFHMREGTGVCLHRESSRSVCPCFTFVAAEAAAIEEQEKCEVCGDGEAAMYICTECAAAVSPPPSAPVEPALLDAQLEKDAKLYYPDAQRGVHDKLHGPRPAAPAVPRKMQEARDELFADDYRHVAVRDYMTATNEWAAAVNAVLLSDTVPDWNEAKRRLGELL